MTAPPIFVISCCRSGRPELRVWSEADLAKLVTRDSMIGVMDPLPAIPE